ncbi:hypothetical protein B0I72DRAFT_93966 [Yarrowia lipolytica]|uniref:YALI0C14674p n=2 Tax=Yarrowia lipolytica TaxID=4952 RepID=Q6CBX4_YARLI|nr:YALI0C14674p [Yarrowia lipolytica CLIB122]RDW25488.1 hypothetical protein B0I71DRAFT_119466 [Yarrowia lipolytica]RDW34213.1 hypothetical protein B0I72DRAFT_93966 [Yarrowia lipolytica]RDW37593.1 hypothetical protein B0I73DRAFT_170909 [Yarrowia lipolytica]RDW44901.1 hypothetical protein B0I74DRAFT_114717 [Yarrowia lipolytica]RDW50951.1 hypothetical protein B0I75DRAFT_140651 [Yarrowia lipolytica]|eukprot:XP_501838.2 YALI0C14674p [Yarrowia lipolytica CLIB122]
MNNMERHKVIIAELLLSLDDDLKRTECLSRLEGLWLEKLRLIEMLKSTIRSKESTLCDFVQWTADAKQRMAVIDRRLVDVERQTLKCPRGQVFEHKSEDPTTMNFTGQWKTRISDLTDQLQHQKELVATLSTKLTTRNHIIGEHKALEKLLRLEVKSMLKERKEHAETDAEELDEWTEYLEVYLEDHKVEWEREKEQLETALSEIRTKFDTAQVQWEQDRQNLVDNHREDRARWKKSYASLWGNETQLLQAFHSDERSKWAADRASWAASNEELSVQVDELKKERDSFKKKHKKCLKHHKKQKPADSPCHLSMKSTPATNTFPQSLIRAFGELDLNKTTPPASPRS